MKKIAVITCYFGSFPWYFEYFLHSCRFNPTIDFFIFTDSDQQFKNKPGNIFFKKSSLKEIEKLLSKKLGFKANIPYPYKLCDVKPAYGFLFPEIIRGYDFWGHSDLDVIYGDIRGFITEEMLKTYDFISLRHDYTTGCFALYRNNEKMNTFFKRSKDYRLVFSSPNHYCFDECNFAWDELTAGKSIFELETEIESFTHLIKAAEASGEIKAHFDFILVEGKTGRVIFDEGKIIYKKQFEGILYHLYWLKKIYNPKRIRKKIPPIYYISPTRIYHSRKQVIEHSKI